MSYAAEPYSQFVDDLLTSLTGGIVRERFVFTPEELTARIEPPGPILRGSLQVFGLASGTYRRFLSDRDFTLSGDSVIAWKARADGTPAADATWPDPGSPFFVNYDFKPAQGDVRLLSDRNVGSVTRLLAESFAREYAVMSLQLEAVYRAGFLDTATGRDLDQLVALVGLSRRNSTFAEGSVTFSRSSAAPADVSIPAGTRLSTAEPPVRLFETTEDETLHRGSLSVDAPVRALVGGLGGAVAAGAISVIHRTILGVDRASNQQPTRLGGATESDEALRARARRALATAGRATPGALVGALATIPGVREKDVLIDEDPIKRPGVITLKVAAELDEAQAARAVEIIETMRPVGVRVLHDLHSPDTLPAISATLSDQDDRDDEAPADAVSAAAGLFFPVVATAVVLPSAPHLSAEDRLGLKREVEAAITDFVAEAGIGETLVYNRLVANIMAVDGVLDASVELYPAALPGLPPPDPATQKRRRNLDVPARLRPSVSASELGAFNADVGGELVALDIAVTVVLKGLALLPDIDQDVILEDIRLALIAELEDKLPGVSPLTPANLEGALTETDTFAVAAVSYQVELVDAGIRVSQRDLTLVLDVRQRAWVRQIEVLV